MAVASLIDDLHRASRVELLDDLATRYRVKFDDARTQRLDIFAVGKGGPFHFDEMLMISSDDVVELRGALLVAERGVRWSPVMSASFLERVSDAIEAGVSAQLMPDDYDSDPSVVAYDAATREHPPKPLVVFRIYE